MPEDCSNCQGVFSVAQTVVCWKGAKKQVTRSIKQVHDNTLFNQNPDSAATWFHSAWYVLLVYFLVERSCEKTPCSKNINKCEKTPSNKYQKKHRKSDQISQNYEKICCSHPTQPAHPTQPIHPT